MINAIIINPYACTIEPVQIIKDYTGWYGPLTTPVGKVTMAEKLPRALQPFFLVSGDMVLVDEERSFKPHSRWFMWAGSYQPYCGNGLIVGTTGEEQSDVKTTLKAVRRFIMFFEGSMQDGFDYVTTPATVMGV